MKAKFISTLTLVLFIIGYGSAQQEIPVNMYTGTPGIFVNLYTLTDHDLSESIALSYNPGDVALDAPHTYGVGWQLTAGTQQVSRQVRGLPDDYLGSGALIRRGWLYASNFSAILNFPNSSDLSAGTCPDEQSDQGFINNLAYENDTEPDWFSFSVGGYSGHFMFGNDGAIHLVPYQDIRIVPHYADAPTSLAITGWTITTSNGVVYSINEANGISRRLTKSSNDENGIDETALSVMERDYQYYRKTVGYVSEWMLSTVASPSGATMTYTYTSKEDTQTSDRDVMLFDAKWQSGSSVTALPDFTLMQESTTVIKKTLSTITASSGTWVSCSPTDGIKVYDPQRAPAIFKQFQLAYNGNFLTSVTESDPSGCNRMPPYQFYYRTPEDYPLQTTGSMQSQDFWGYYNGGYNRKMTSTGGMVPCMIPTIYVYPNESGADRYRLYPLPSYSGTSFVLNGCANRQANPNYILFGTLSRLAYPAGGEAHFTFEANQFYDAKANKNQYGGGIRINRITYYDGVNTAPNIVKYFNYTDANGHSSGHLITRPAYALPLWQQVVPTMGTHTGYTKSLSQLATAEAQWRAMTLVTGFDVSDQDYTQGSAVGYSRVTVTRPGNGKAMYEYAVPATYGDSPTGNTATDWNATVTRFSRPSDCPSMGLISTGEASGYPSFPNNYYDYERGLQTSKTEYNNSGIPVRYTQNTYQYLFKSGSQPSSIAGLSYDLLANSSNIYLYGRYTQLADVVKVPLSETVTTYDENNTSRASSEVTQYNYESSYHRMVSSIKRTTSDGTAFKSYLKYVPDFVASTATPSDTALWMIQRFMANGQNSVVIETRNTIQPSGGSEKTTGATLLKFNPFVFDKPLLRTTMAFRPAVAATDFVTASVSQNVLVYDSRYKIVSTVNEYNGFNVPLVPLSATGEDRATQASLWGYGNRVPVASIRQARTVSVGFSDFETTNSASFSVSNAYTGMGRTGANGIHPYATLTRTIAKPAGAVAYVLAFWLKNTANTTVTLQVTAKNTSGSVLSSNNYTYTLKGSGYEYFIQPINVSGLPGNFVIEIKGQSLSQPAGSSPSLLPLLDDVAFYPDYASLSSVTYDFPFGTNSSTDETGLTMYTSFDALGRVRWVKDQDNNIRKRFTYQLTGDTAPTLTAVVAGHSGNYVSLPVTFTAQDNSCLTGEFYEWDFGGGFTAPSQSNSAQHTYQAAGTYTATLRVSHPSYVHPVTTTTSVTLIYPPLEQESCATGVKTITNGVVTQSYACFTNTASANYITTKILSVGYTYGQAVTYTWQKRIAGTSNWVWTGTNSSATYGPVKVELNSTSGFDLKCVISTSDGRSVDSDIFSVTIIN